MAGREDGRCVSRAGMEVGVRKTEVNEGSDVALSCPESAERVCTSLQLTGPNAVAL